MAAGQSDASVALPFLVKVGQQFAINIAKETEERGSDGQTQLRGVAVDVTAEVVGQLPDGYVFRWTYGQPRRTSRLSLPEMALFGFGDLSALAEGWSVEFRTDANGIPIAVTNLEEVRKRGQSVSEEVIALKTKQMRDDGESGDKIADREKTLRDYAGLWNSPADRLQLVRILETLHQRMESAAA